MKRFVLPVLAAFCAPSTADIINYEFSAWSARGSDSDLFRFITRPDLTPPKLDVTFYNRDKTSSGYLFVAPYDCLECSHRPTTSYVTQQIGPHIYTQEGELVWSGNDLFPDKKVFDFRPVMINGEYHLAAITPQDAEWHPFPDGAAMLLNSSYDLVYNITSEDLGNRIDLHEFNVIDDGSAALLAVKEPRDTTEADHTPFKGKIMESYVLELDLETQEHLFTWRASDHVSVLESDNPPPKQGSQHKHWDWFHLNSIDKSAEGNYLISARATNTLYYISAIDGSILWRLGGLQSSFEQDFNFSRQHHARIRRQTKTDMVISFFDNAADDSGDYEPTSPESSARIVALNFPSMKATLYHRHPRPDGGHSEAKGNVEYLPNGGVFCGWGENAYVSEYSKPGGVMVYEMSFASRRFANYRAYKMDFIGRPTTKPAVKAFASANSLGQLTTSIYVSWNGATEVSRWRFYSHAAKQGVLTTVELGMVQKTGFETSYSAQGFHPIIYAEAIDVLGNSLSNSTLEVTELPLGFHNPKNPIYSKQQPPSESEPDRIFEILIAFVAGIGFSILFKNFHLGRHTSSWRPQPLVWRGKEK